MGKKIFGAISGAIVAFAAVVGFLFLSDDAPTEDPVQIADGVEEPGPEELADRGAEAAAGDGTVPGRAASGGSGETLADRGSGSGEPTDPVASGVALAAADPRPVEASTLDVIAEPTPGADDDVPAVPGATAPIGPVATDAEPSPGSETATEDFAESAPVSPTPSFAAVNPEPEGEARAPSAEDTGAAASAPVPDPVGLTEPSALATPGSDDEAATLAPGTEDAAATQAVRDLPDPLDDETLTRENMQPSAPYAAAIPLPDASLVAADQPVIAAAEQNSAVSSPVEDAALPEMTIAAITPEAGAGSSVPAPSAAVPSPGLPAAGRVETDTARPPEADVSPETPIFDLVRVARDGQTVIAGRAQPGRVVEVLLDGQVVERATADRKGQFVSILYANEADAPRSLELRTRLPESLRAPEEPPLTVEGSDTTGTGEAAEPSALLASPEAPNGGTLPENTGLPAVVASTDALNDAGSASRDLTASAPAADATLPDLTALNLSGDAPQRVPATAGEPPSRADGDRDVRYAVSAPVIILPAEGDDGAPTLVGIDESKLSLIQPSDRDVTGVILDTITYGEAGDVILTGRGIPPRVIRIYANAQPVGVAQVGEDGLWSYALPEAGASDIKLFRMDELDDSGGVTSRIETPFQYRRFNPQVLRQRRVVVQRGDMLWRIAEQYYGEGIRYSMIYGANTELIRDPDLIYPGQVFSIPELVDAN